MVCININFNIIHINTLSYALPIIASNPPGDTILSVNPRLLIVYNSGASNGPEDEEKEAVGDEKWGFEIYYEFVTGQ